MASVTGGKSAFVSMIVGWFAAIIIAMSVKMSRPARKTVPSVATIIATREKNGFVTSIADLSNQQVKHEKDTLVTIDGLFALELR
jgi:hypothetical protein